MKKVQKEIDEVRGKHKDNPQEMSKKVMEIYKREDISLFSSFFSLILQIPIFFALYLIFSKGVHVDQSSLYSFISFPETLHTQAFGILDVTKKNLVIGILAGISSFVYGRQQAKNLDATQPKSNKEPSFQESFQRSMSVQMKYVFPVLIATSASVFPAAVGLYWIVGNVINILQDMYLKSKLKSVLK
jgi:YidC/Oxa1 family membrane protein insertase